MKHPRQRFVDRIGKTIYRDKLECTCKNCQKTSFEIFDELHDTHLFDCQNEMNIEYRETLDPT